MGSTGGTLDFLDRRTGTGVSLIKEYRFGSNESVSGIAFDVNGSSNDDGRLYDLNLVSDPTNGSS